MTNAPFKSYVLGFSYVIFLWENYLSYRQHQKLKEKKIPHALESIVKQEDFEKANAYGLDKSKFGFVSGIFSQIQTTIVFYYDLLPWFWNFAGSWITYFGLEGNWEITQSIIFLVVISLISTVLNLPFSLYYTFVIEERHGFNKQTLGLFFADFLKGLLISGIIGVPVVAAFLWIIQWTGDNFALYVWLFMLVFQLVMVTIYPTLIQPLFNKFTPLEEGELKDKIHALAARIGFPLTKLFVIDGSKRSSHSNAYFYGFFKNKRIVLFDTLLEHSENEEVCGVLAHELGHWKHNHITKTLIITQTHLFLIFYLFAGFIHFDPLYKSFGFDSQPILIGFLLFQYIYMPVESVAGFAMNILSRFHEFQADHFAKSLGYAKVLKSALVKLHTKNLGNMNPDSLYSQWHYSHPPLVERLNAIGKTD
ncbi:CAAX prenyl protease 1 [Quaeritorhiza haematococci]|nr:CAAX prenyl protease 1 [Quaeritorhiza haematococci]